MADKKKNTSRSGSRTGQTSLKTGGKGQPVKSIGAMARDESKSTDEQTKRDGKQSGVVAQNDEKKASAKVENKPAKSVATAIRNEPRKERAVQEARARRDTKEPSWLLRFRNSRVGRFVLDAYYELRHKVTWPTFEEARNMTLIVIALSAVIGAAIALVDYGLYNLFLLISGGR